MSRYEVIVAENARYQDAEAHASAGVFATAEAAVAACEAIVDRSLRECDELDGGGAAALLAHYRLYGQDPFVVRRDASAPEVAFSAWTYARERAEALAATAAARRG